MRAWPTPHRKPFVDRRRSNQLQNAGRRLTDKDAHVRFALLQQGWCVRQHGDPMKKLSDDGEVKKRPDDINPILKVVMFVRASLPWRDAD